MTDSLAIFSFTFLTLTAGIFGWFKEKFISRSRILAEQEETARRHYVVTVAADDHLMIVEMVKAVLFIVLEIIFYLSVLSLYFIELGFINILFLIAATVFLYLVYRVTRKIHWTIDAYHLYFEEKEMVQQIDSEQDETTYLFSSPENAERLKNALKEYELRKQH